jgi:hypothetical protein
VEVKVVQEMLGHSSIVLTADTYTSVLPEIAHKAAEKTAAHVLKAGRLVPGTKRTRCRASTPKKRRGRKRLSTGEYGTASQALTPAARSDIRKDAELHCSRPAGPVRERMTRAFTAPCR